MTRADAIAYVANLKQLYPSPRRLEMPLTTDMTVPKIHPGYCVGGAVCKGKPAWPKIDYLAAILRAIAENDWERWHEPMLPRYPYFACRIIEANDSGRFEEAWNLVVKALDTELPPVPYYRDPTSSEALSEQHNTYTERRDEHVSVLPVQAPSVPAPSVPAPIGGAVPLQVQPSNGVSIPSVDPTPDCQYRALGQRRFHHQRRSRRQRRQWRGIRTSTQGV